MFSNKCLQLTKRYEGFRAHAYPDPRTGGAPWTIGYGFTKVNGVPVKKGDVMTQERANELMHDAMVPFNKVVNDSVNVKLSQEQEDALSCFVYNVGPTTWLRSTARKRLNRGDYKGAIEAATWYISPGTRVEQGLKARRKAEKKLFLTGNI